jgi:serine/threonine protein kinase
VSELEAGKQIGNYVLEAKLGRGGMGVVFVARDLALQRHVALKLLAPELTQDAAARTRFQREIKAAVAIEHPHVVPVYAAGYEDGYFFLAMRCVKGRDLSALIDEGGPLPEERAMRLVGQIASALAFVHEHGLVHRDVKPHNVLLWSSDHGEEHAFLTDFGIAKAVDEVFGITKMGALGTRGYMALEVVNGAPATPASDQYSLAVLAFELLTGDLPFDSDDELRDLPRPLAALAPETSRETREAIEQGLANDPADRFASVLAFARANEAAHDSFDRAQEITDTLTRVRSDSELVGSLTNQGLSAARIAEIGDLERSHVLLLRRRAARRSIIGEGS